MTSNTRSPIAPLPNRVEEDFQMDYVGFLKENFEEIRRQLRERREKGNPLVGFSMRETLSTMMSGGNNGRSPMNAGISLEELASLKRRLNSNIEELSAYMRGNGHARNGHAENAVEEVEEVETEAETETQNIRRSSSRGRKSSSNGGAANGKAAKGRSSSRARSKSKSRS